MSNIRGATKEIVGAFHVYMDSKARLVGIGLCLIGFFSLFDLPGDALGSMLLILWGASHVLYGGH